MLAAFCLMALLSGCGDTRLDTGMGSSLTIKRYGVHGATVQYANPYNPGGYVYELRTWDELKREYPMLSDEFDELRRKAVEEKKWN